MTVKELTKIGILSAVAFVLMLIEFPIPMIAPPFYKMDFSEVAVLMGGFAIGPWAAVIIEAMKNLLNIMFTGSSTAYVGEFANFLVGCAFAVPAALIYQHKKTRKNAVIGLVCGALCMILAGALINYLVLLPLYSSLYHMPMETIIDMGKAVVPAIKDRFTFVLLATSPFNLIKGVLVGLLTFMLYKTVSPLLHK